jgi:hypothetical protein
MSNLRESGDVTPNREYRTRNRQRRMFDVDPRSEVTGGIAKVPIGRRILMAADVVTKETMAPEGQE